MLQTTTSTPRARTRELTDMSADEINLRIGNNIRKRRKFLDISQTELAAAVGVSFQQVQKWECAANRVMPNYFPFIAKALEVEIGYFFS